VDCKTPPAPPPPDAPPPPPATIKYSIEVVCENPIEKRKIKTIKTLFFTVSNF
jgi:hypothetical protein